MTIQQLSQKYSALTGIRANISDLITNATTADKKKSVYEHLMWHIKNGEIRKVDGIKELVAEVIPALAEALSQNSTAEVVEEPKYTAEEAAAYNLKLKGAWAYGKVKTPAVEAQAAVPYADAAEYNAAKGTELTDEQFAELTDEQKTKTPAVTAQEAVLYTNEEVDAYNATLPGAKHKGDPKPANN